MKFDQTVIIIIMYGCFGMLISLELTFHEAITKGSISGEVFTALGSIE